MSGGFVNTVSSSAVLASVLAALVPVVAATLAAWLKERAERRDREVRRRRALGRALEEVGFIDSWIKVHKNVASPQAYDQARIQAQKDLERAYAVLSDSILAVRREADDEMFSPSRELRRLLVVLLLVGQAPTRAAKAMRTVYRLFLLSTLGAVVLTAVSTVNPDDIVASELTALFFFVPPTWLARALAMRLARRRSAVTSAAPTAAERPDTDAARPGTGYVSRGGVQDRSA